MFKQPQPMTFFDSWNPNMSYVLGFWWADGTIYKNKVGTKGGSVSFASADRDHLESVNQVMGGGYKVVFRGDCYRLYIYRNNAVKAIEMLGGFENKSLLAQWNHVPEEHLADFVRGYVDGDGSLGWALNRSIPNPLIQICGTTDFLSGMANQIEASTGIALTGIYTASGKIPQLRYSGIKAKCLSIWLYKKSMLHLERKKKIADLFALWMPRTGGFKRRVVTPKMREVFNADVFPH